MSRLCFFWFDFSFLNFALLRKVFGPLLSFLFSLFNSSNPQAPLFVHKFFSGHTAFFG